MFKKHSGVYLTLLTLILLAVPLGIWLVYASRSPKAGEYDWLARCLTAKGVKMYGAYWCGHCQNQKRLFGSAWQYVSYVECALPGGEQKQICQEAGIKGYPTWVMGDGEKIEREMSLEELQTKTSCVKEGGESQ